LHKSAQALAQLTEAQCEAQREATWALCAAGAGGPSSLGFSWALKDVFLKCLKQPK